jgi:type I restriction-modification system DNA methylase subunit
MRFLKLLNRNKEAEPKTYELVYGLEVEKKLTERGYNPGKIQAILNNYLAEPDNEKYVREFLELQEVRKECKAEVKEVNN